MTGPQITTWVIWAAVGLLLGYDLFVLMRYGIDGTISAVVMRATVRWPAIPFALGFLMGHLFGCGVNSQP